MGQFIKSGRRLPPEAQVKSRLGATLFYDSMLKIAALKSERGGRSWSSDLCQPLSHEGQNTNTEEHLETGRHDGHGVQNTMEFSVAAAGQGKVDLGPFSQGQVVPQEWDDAFWGWDLARLDAADWQMDWNGLESWQP